jgi:hypothetical protein
MALMIFSAAPLSSMDLPIIAAIAIRMPTLEQVLPNSIAIRSPILLCDCCSASAAEMPLDRKNCSTDADGVSSATTNAASNSDKNGWSLNPIIPPTTITIPIKRIKMGFAMIRFR